VESETEEKESPMLDREVEEETQDAAPGERCAVCGKKPWPDDTIMPSSGNRYCRDCYAKVTHYPIPKGVLLFVLALFAVTLAGLFLNGRFFLSLYSIREAGRSFGGGDAEAAARFSDTAFKLVPENAEIQALHNYYNGILGYVRGEYETALPMLTDYIQTFPEDSLANRLVLTMEISKCFDEKDWGLMSRKADKLMEMDPEDPLAILQYASSLACVWAAEGDASSRDKSRELIEKVRGMDVGDDRDEIIRYIDRIEYRLRTRKIIDSDEYDLLSAEEKA
jgi:hypothetical protein